MSATPQHIRTEDLSAYIDGVLGDDERSAIAVHLEACAECRNELAELRATVRLLNQLPQLEPRRSFQLGMEFDTHRTERSTVVRLLPVVRSLSVAAVILFLVATSALFLENTGNIDESTPSQSAIQRETGEVDDTSQGAGDDAEADTTGEQPPTGNPAPEDSRPIDRGAAASSGDEPLEDLTNLQEAQETAEDGAVGEVAQAGEPGTSERSLPRRLSDEYGTAFVTGLGGLALVLVSLWIILLRMSRRVRRTRI